MPRSGVPVNPDAWLVTAARNSLKNTLRHRGVIDACALDLALQRVPAEQALQVAIGLAEDAAIRAFLLGAWRD